MITSSTSVQDSTFGRIHVDTTYRHLVVITPETTKDFTFVISALRSEREAVLRRNEGSVAVRMMYTTDKESHSASTVINGTNELGSTVYDMLQRYGFDDRCLETIAAVVTTQLGWMAR